MAQALGEGSAMKRVLSNGSASASGTASASVPANAQDRNRDCILERLVSSCTILRFVFVAVFTVVAIATVLYLFGPLLSHWTVDSALAPTDGGGRNDYVPAVGHWVHGVSLLAMLSLLLWRVQKMLQFIADKGTPFRPQVYSALKFVARMLILLPILPTVLTFAVSSACAQFGFEGSVRVSAYFGLDTIFIGIILHIVANVFEYGCLLQTQDDGLI